MKFSRKLCSVFLAATMLLFTAMPASALTLNLFNGNVQYFMDVFDQMYSPYEELEKTYLSSLESILDYANDPTEARLQALQELLARNSRTLSRIEFPGYVSDAKAEKFMRQKALSQPDLQAMADSFAASRDLSLDALELYRHTLELSAAGQADLSLLMDHISTRLELEKLLLEHNFYACNEFFMPLKGSALAYAKETFAARYPTLCPETLTWQTDMNALLRQEEKLTKRENKLVERLVSGYNAA